MVPVTWLLLTFNLAVASKLKIFPVKDPAKPLDTAGTLAGFVDKLDAGFDPVLLGAAGAPPTRLYVSDPEQ